jgi:hypothetical protein
MIEVQVKCHICQRRYLIERENRSLAKPVCGHGTILTPAKSPNLMQCACGQYLDDRHTAQRCTRR